MSASVLESSALLRQLDDMVGNNANGNQRAEVVHGVTLAMAPAAASDDDEVSTSSEGTTSSPEPAPVTEPSPGASLIGDVAPGASLRAPEYYLNRELTWLEFNRRVLAEAKDRRTPLLERVKFLAISAGTLDEFFMKRIGGLKQQMGAEVRVSTPDGRTPRQQFEACLQVVGTLIAEQQELLRHLIKLLRKHEIYLLNFADLSASEVQWVRGHYLRNIFPLVTPQAIDPAHPFPFISNLSLNLLVTLHYRDDDSQSLARVKVPVGSGVPRFIRVGESHRYVALEEVMANNLDLLFPGMVVDACELFHVTRNANTEVSEERADDLLMMIESELRDRKFAPIVRMTAQKGMNPTRRGMIAAELGLDEAADVFETDGMMGLSDLRELSAIVAPSLHDSPFHAVEHPRLAADHRSIFHIIREAPLLLMHPYESFQGSVERFLREAAVDPKVLAIKMTLYRASRESAIIEHLATAARNGKQVAVVVELKARFDEAANIRWANYLEEAGIHVTYGVVGLKTHCKTTLVVRRDYDGLRRYAHISTGNYNEDTARLYSDLALFTADQDIAQDLTELFNYLTTGYTPDRNYRKLLVAPKSLKRALLTKIAREMQVRKDTGQGLIQIKTNALEDPEIVRALYRASQAGVTVDLLVRDTCRLRPGVPGISENVRVVSIVGRFLEHARVFYFRNGGAEEYYIGSADLMQRNLKSRVEVVTPVDDASLREQLRFVLDAQLSDQRNGWDMAADGSYTQRQPQPGDKRASQQQFIDFVEKRFREATRLKARKPRGLATADKDLE